MAGWTKTEKNVWYDVCCDCTLLPLPSFVSMYDMARVTSVFCITWYMNNQILFDVVVSYIVFISFMCTFNSMGACRRGLRDASSRKAECEIVLSSKSPFRAREGNGAIVGGQGHSQNFLLGGLTFPFTLLSPFSFPSSLVAPALFPHGKGSRSPPKKI